ncbi:MAG: ATP-binding protein [Pseudomonadota bacterium]
MISVSDSNDQDKERLYNVRITKIYLHYTKLHYPHIDQDSLLEYAKINRYELEDTAHWLTQEQVDRFHEILVAKTGNQDVARDAGRYAAFTGGLAGTTQYAMGMISLNSAYFLMGKLYDRFSKGVVVRSTKLGASSAEIVATPRPGVDEKPYQCKNRIGSFESLGKLFTGDYSEIDHPACFHKGDESCRYIIKWKKNPSVVQAMIRNYSLLIGVPASLILFFILPKVPWMFFSFFWVLLATFLTCFAWRSEKKELIKTIEVQGNAAKDLLDEINIRYNNALFVQEIGHAISTTLDIDTLISTVAGIMERRLDFDRGTIMLADKHKTRLAYQAGYGYSPEKEALLRTNAFHLDLPGSQGPFVRAFNEQKPFLINDISEIEKKISKRSRELKRQMGVQSFICVPIIYEKESLGILAVDNVVSKRHLSQSDISLLAGVASQTAVSLINARSFEKLQESEKKYRELVENANSIILRMDADGKITFFNEFAQKFFVYPEDEVIGLNALGILFPDDESSRRRLEALVKALIEEPERQITTENETVLRNGESVWVAWAYKPIFDHDGNFIEILCIGNDITELHLTGKEKKDLENQLLRAQKMEAIGTLAGGIAHDFNNILQAISGYTQLLQLGKEPDHPDNSKLATIEKSVRTASDLTRSLLIFSRKVQSELRPVDLNHEVVHVSKMLERVIPKMIKIEMQLDAKLKHINADSAQMEQVIMNLGINARDAMAEKGSLLFKTENVVLDEAYCRRHLGAHPGPHALLKVSDSGQGMDGEILEHIFEPFFTTKALGKGTGLGLAMVYGIVKSHGGYIHCESKPGRGTTFMIYFPVLERIRERKESLIGEEGPAIGGDETVLLVDDDENIRRLGEEILTRYGYSVMLASDGESALDLYRKADGKIDIILLDLIMPGMGGRQCLENLIKIDPRVKIVIATGYSFDGYTRETIQKWSQGVITKPYDLKKMLRIVRQVLDKK